jgi:hypothetical protein
MKMVQHASLTNLQKPEQYQAVCKISESAHQQAVEKRRRKIRKNRSENEKQRKVEIGTEISRVGESESSKKKPKQCRAVYESG